MHSKQSQSVLSVCQLCSSSVWHPNCQHPSLFWTETSPHSVHVNLIVKWAAKCVFKHQHMLSCHYTWTFFCFLSLITDEIYLGFLLFRFHILKEKVVGIYHISERSLMVGENRKFPDWKRCYHSCDFWTFQIRQYGIMPMHVYHFT